MKNQDEDANKSAERCTITEVFFENVFLRIQSDAIKKPSQIEWKG